MKKGDDMTFDFKKRGRTLREVGREEKNAAMQELIGYVAGSLKGKTQYGAFAKSWFGSKTAVEYFTDVAYGVVFDRHKLDAPKAWRDDLLLTDLLKRAAWSAMGHWKREWERLHNKYGCEITESALPEPEVFAAKLAVALDEDKMDDAARMAADKEADEHRRIGFEEVEKLVKDKPILAKYVKAVKETYSMRDISKRMKMTIAQCEEIEAELLKLIDEYLERKHKIPKSRVVSMG